MQTRIGYAERRPFTRSAQLLVGASVTPTSGRGWWGRHNIVTGDTIARWGLLPQRPLDSSVVGVTVALTCPHLTPRQGWTPRVAGGGSARC